MKKDADISSLEHTAWRCQYHVVFAPKYRRMEIYGAIKQDIGVILRKLCQQKGVEIIEAEACPDHIHMLISIPPKYSVSQIMGYLKGKSSLMIFDRHANLKYKYGNRHFWARGYYVDTVVSSQVKRAKFRHKVYQFWGGVSPQSIPAEKLVSNGLVVLEPVAGAGHVNNLAAVDEAVKDSGGNGGVAEEVGPLVKPLVGSNDQ